MGQRNIERERGSEKEKTEKESDGGTVRGGKRVRQIEGVIRGTV